MSQDPRDRVIRLHLSVDNYKGEILYYDEKSIDEQIFYTFRMLPPGEVSYYFSEDG